MKYPSDGSDPNTSSLDTCRNRNELPQFVGERFPIGQGSLQQFERAHDVRADESTGVADRAIDVGLGGKVDDRLAFVASQQIAEEGPVRDVPLHKDVLRRIAPLGQRVEAGGVGQQVQIDDSSPTLLQDPAYKIAADEAGASGNQDRVHRGPVVTSVESGRSLPGLARTTRCRTAP